MEMEFGRISDPQLIDSIVAACAEADSRGLCDHHVSQQALLGLVMRMFLTIGEVATAEMLSGTLRFVEDGSFAAMLEEIGFIPRVPMS